MGIVMVVGGMVEIVCLRLVWWCGGWRGGDWCGDWHGECSFFFFLGGYCGQCLGLVVLWFLGLVVAWWPVSCGCCDGFLVVPVVAKLWL